VINDKNFNYEHDTAFTVIPFTQKFHAKYVTWLKLHRGETHNEYDNTINTPSLKHDHIFKHGIS
jgi:hypothetical protein